MDTTAQIFDALENDAILLDESAASTSVALDATTPVLVPIQSSGLGPGVYDFWCEGANLDATKKLIIKWVSIGDPAPAAGDMTPATGSIKQFIVLPSTAWRALRMNPKRQLYVHSIGFTGTFHIARRRSVTDPPYGK